MTTTSGVSKTYEYRVGLLGCLVPTSRVKRFVILCQIGALLYTTVIVAHQPVLSERQSSEGQRVALEHTAVSSEFKRECVVLCMLCVCVCGSG